MSRWTRNGLLALGVLGSAAALFVVSAAVGSPRGSAPPTDTRAAAQPADPLARSIARLQERLEAQPKDSAAWSQLGQAYVEQARRSADPSFYAKADGAFATSLRLQPTDNVDALVGSASLAAARHEFAEALKLVNRALAINPYTATGYGVQVDALTELGRYDQARSAAQRMLDLRPGVDSFARASYQLELRGDVAGAKAAMQRAVDVTTGGPDRAFALFHLGELAWNAGDLKGARTSYDAALAADPGYLPAVAGQARTLAASGDTTAALALYREAVQAQPQPQYLVELGELLEATGQAEAAREQYDVVRATQQLFTAAGADVDIELALFEADHGDPATALKYAAAAYKDRPSSVHVQDGYAWALHRSGRSAEALPIARQAQRLGLRLPYLRYHLGVIEAAAGDKGAARKALSSALSLNPAFSPLQAPEAKKLLAAL